MANGAALAQRFVLEDEGPGLITMTLSARLIEARQTEATSWFHDVCAMRIVTLNTVHFAFDNRMMLRKRKLGMRFQMALKTGSRVLAGIQNEPSLATTGFDVLAAGTVARFAAALSDSGIRRELHPGVRATGKLIHIIGVALKTGLVADVISAWNGGAHHDRSRCCGTGVCHAQNQKP